MSELNQRDALARLVTERREDYSNLSRVIGRNPSYIQQFIKRGSPKQLSGEDTRTLARYLQVSEHELGGTQQVVTVAEAGLVLLPRYDIGASAGPGALDPDDHPSAYMGFDKDWLRQVSAARTEDLSIIKVRGDSMLPTLADGDDIMVDRSRSGGRLEDGIYVLRRDDTLIVKRVAINPATRRATISSDNSTYPSWPDCNVASLNIVGRVVWAGRKMA